MLRRGYFVKGVIRLLEFLMPKINVKTKQSKKKTSSNGKKGRIKEDFRDRIGYIRKGGDGTGLLIYYEPVGPESPQSSWSLGVLSHVDRKQKGHGKYSGNFQSSKDTSLKLTGSEMRILDFLSSQAFIMRPPPDKLEMKHGGTHLQFQHGAGGEGQG